MKGREVEAGTLTGYFIKHDEAQRAFRKLKRRGFRRAALVHKTIDGRIHTRDPFLLRCVLGVTLAAILIGGLAGFASLVFHWSELILSGTLSTLIPILAGGSVGTLFGRLWIRRSKYGIDRRLLKSHYNLAASSGGTSGKRRDSASSFRPASEAREPDRRCDKPRCDPFPVTGSGACPAPCNGPPDEP